jgi:hypothetical protein
MSGCDAHAWDAVVSQKTGYQALSVNIEQPRLFFQLERKAPSIKPPGGKEVNPRWQWRHILKEVLNNSNGGRNQAIRYFLLGAYWYLAAVKREKLRHSTLK